MKVLWLASFVFCHFHLCHAYRQSQQITLSQSVETPTCSGNTVYIPDTTNCSQYYYCNGGLPHLMLCPSGLNFDSINFYCDYPSNAVCGTTATAGSSPSASPSGASPTPAPTSSPTNPSTAGECLPNVDYVPDLVNCSKYYFCNGGIPFAMHCPQGLEYDYLNLQCDFPSVSTCYPSAVSDFSASASASSPCGNASYAPDNNNCSNYFFCNGNVLQPLHCPQGLYFDSLSLTCDYPNLVTCAGNSSIPTLSPTNAPSSATPIPTSNTDVTYPVPVITGPRPGSDYVRGCYFTNWAQYRDRPYNFNIFDIHISLCNTIYYAFAKFDSSFQLVPYESNDLSGPDGMSTSNVGTYDKMYQLKQFHPKLKVLLSIGGWTFNDCSVNNQTCRLYSDMASSSANRAKFIGNSVSFLRKYHFDGIDLDWEFPAYSGRNGLGRETPQDKKNLVSLVNEFRQYAEDEAALTGRPRLLITAAVGVGESITTDAYDIAALCDNKTGLDHVNLMTYDFHGSWDGYTGHNAPLYASAEDRQHGVTQSCNSTVYTWITHGCNPKKLVMGMASYGRGFNLTNGTEAHGFYAPTSGVSPPGPGLKAAGMYSYMEIDQMLTSKSLKEVWDSDRGVPYAYNSTVWVGYDNEQSIKLKAEYVKSMGLGGAMFWTVDMDKFQRKEYPLIRAMNKVILDDSELQKNATTQNDKNRTGAIQIVPRFPDGVWDGSDCSPSVLRKLPKTCRDALTENSSKEEILSCTLISQPGSRGIIPFGTYKAKTDLHADVPTLDNDAITRVFDKCALAKFIHRSCFVYTQGNFRGEVEHDSYSDKGEYFHSHSSSLSVATTMTPTLFGVGVTVGVNHAKSSAHSYDKNYDVAKSSTKYHNNVGILSMDTCILSNEIDEDVFDQKYLNRWRNIANIGDVKQLMQNEDFIEIAEGGISLPTTFGFSVGLQSILNHMYNYISTSQSDSKTWGGTFGLSYGVGVSSEGNASVSGTITFSVKTSHSTAHAHSIAITHHDNKRYGDCAFENFYSDTQGLDLLGQCAANATENLAQLRRASNIPKGGFTGIQFIIDKLGIPINPLLGEAMRLYFASCTCNKGGGYGFTCSDHTGTILRQGQLIQVCNDTFWYMRDTLPNKMSAHAIRSDSFSVNTSKTSVFRLDSPLWGCSFEVTKNWITLVNYYDFSVAFSVVIPQGTLKYDTATGRLQIDSDDGTGTYVLIDSCNAAQGPFVLALNEKGILLSYSLSHGFICSTFNYQTLTRVSDHNTIWFALQLYLNPTDQQRKLVHDYINEYGNMQISDDSNDVLSFGYLDSAFG